MRSGRCSIPCAATEQRPYRLCLLHGERNAAIRSIPGDMSAAVPLRFMRTARSVATKPGLAYSAKGAEPRLGPRLASRDFIAIVEQARAPDRDLAPIFLEMARFLEVWGGCDRIDWQMRLARVGLNSRTRMALCTIVAVLMAQALMRSRHLGRPTIAIVLTESGGELSLIASDSGGLGPAAEGLDLELVRDLIVWLGAVVSYRHAACTGRETRLDLLLTARHCDA